MEPNLGVLECHYLPTWVDIDFSSEVLAPDASGSSLNNQPYMRETPRLRVSKKWQGLFSPP